MHSDSVSPTIHELPVELLAHIFEYFDLRELATFSRLSRRLHDAVAIAGVRDYVKRRRDWTSLGTGLYPPFSLPRKPQDITFWWKLARRCSQLERNYLDSEEKQPPTIRTLHAAPRRTPGRGATSGYLPVIKSDHNGLLFFGVGDAVEICRLGPTGNIFSKGLLAKPHGRAPAGDVTDLAVASSDVNGSASFWTASFDGTLKRHHVESAALAAHGQLSSDILDISSRVEKDKVLAPSAEMFSEWDVYLDAHNGKMISSIDCRAGQDSLSGSTTLLSAGFDGFVKLWSVADKVEGERHAAVSLVGAHWLSTTGKPMRPWITRFLGPSLAIVGHTASSSTLRNASDSLSILEIHPTGELSRTARLNHHKGAVYAVSTRPKSLRGSDKQFVSCGFDGSAAFWDLRTSMTTPSIAWDDWDLYASYSVVWDGFNKVVVGTGRHGVVRGWDLRMVGKRVEPEPVTSIFAFSKGKDTPVYGLEADLSRWWVGGEGEIRCVEL